MTIKLGTQGQPDFDEPIALMMDCHRRIEHFLDVLKQVVTARSGRALDAEHARALRTALDYFQSGAPRHTADEEESLFPRMRQVNDPKVQSAMKAMDELEADHREAEKAHQRVDQLGRQWLENGSLGEAELNELQTLLDELQAKYRQHIAVEDEQIFPLADQVLKQSQQARIGQEMRQRRVEAPGREGSRCAQRRQQTLGGDPPT